MKSFYVLLFPIIILFNSPLTSFAQDDEEEEIPEACKTEPSDKKVLKLYEKGLDHKKYDYNTRMRALKDALELEEECSSCMWEIAKLTYRRAQAKGTAFDIPKKYYLMIENTCPEYHADVYYNLGVIYYGEKNDCKAYEYFQKFLDFPSDDEKKLSRKYDQQLTDVEGIMEEVDFYCNYFKNKVPYNPVVVKNISTASKDEYLPMISPDNELMYFTREYDYKGKGDIITSKIQEFTESKRPNAEAPFDGGAKMKKPFNVGPKYGGASISINNKEMYICACAKQADYWNCDLFMTKFELVEENGKEVKKWGELVNLGPNINGPDTWEAQPSLSADGNTLYFASARPGGKGKIDIYYSKRTEDGSWGPAENMGYPINTPGSDKVPFMHTDSRTLYFVSECSQYRLGAGGFDIFYSKQDKETGKWSRPKNIGYPINSEGNEEGIIVSTDGEIAYFSSDAGSRGLGGKDVFYFSLPEDAKPDKVILMKGKVETENIEDIKDAKLTVRFESGKVEEQEIVVDDEGEYVAVANVGKGEEDALLEIKKEGKAFESKLVKKEEASKTFIKDQGLEIKDIKKGSTHTINDILFKTNSSELSESSKLVLDGFADWLKENPTLKFEIQGHTDDVGNDNDNLALSQDRAFTVMEYLSTRGIKTSRMKFKGYGETKPKVKNDTPENRAKNRRTDFLIL